MFAYYILLGIGFGCNMSLMPTAMTNSLGMDHYPRIMGSAMPILSILSGFVPVIAGIVFDSIGSYGPVYVSEAVVCFIGCAFAVSLRFPKR